MAVRRRFTQEFKLAVVREYLAGGVSRAALARQYDVALDQIQAWQKRYKQGRLNDQPPNRALSWVLLCVYVTPQSGHGDRKAGEDQRQAGADPSPAARARSHQKKTAHCSPIVTLSDSDDGARRYAG